VKFQHGDRVRACSISRAISHEGHRARGLQKLSNPVSDLLAIGVPVVRVGGVVILEHGICHATPPEGLVPVQPRDSLFSRSMLSHCLKLIVSM
jgi:hypothetical protein